MSANGRAGHSHARPGLVNANPMVDPHARKAMKMLFDLHGERIV